MEVNNSKIESLLQSVDTPALQVSFEIINIVFLCLSHGHEPSNAATD